MYSVSLYSIYYRLPKCEMGSYLLLVVFEINYGSQTGCSISRQYLGLYCYQNGLIKITRIYELSGYGLALVKYTQMVCAQWSKGINTYQSTS